MRRAVIADIHGNLPRLRLSSKTFAGAPLTALSGSPHARYALLGRQSGRWIVDLIAVEYNWSAASTRALENGRFEWAQGVATGFLSLPFAA